MKSQKTSSMNSGRTLVLSDKAIEKLVSLQEALPLVEAGFAADARGRAVALPVMVRLLKPFGIHFGIKSGYLQAGNSPGQTECGNKMPACVGDVVGLKAGGYWLRNPALGLSGHRAVILLLDPETGNAVALMSANWITRIRTAAAGAVAAKYLARHDVRVVAIIGAGEQAHAQLQGLRMVREIQQAYVWARQPDAAEAYASTWREAGLRVKAVRDIREATEPADVVITATPSTEALVWDSWIRPGTHVTAIGSDGEGKQELDVRLLQRAKVVVDKIPQSISIGELQHAVREGLNATEMIHAELGEICAGLKPGRENEEEITVFDSSGVSFQDLIVAGYLVHCAKAAGVGEYVSL
jgi:alanine dehydrogenase